MGALDLKPDQPAGYLRPDAMRAAAEACGTQADLSGWSMMLFLTPAEYERTPDPVDAATRLLGLTRQQAVQLFLTDDDSPARTAIHADRHRITAPDAAHTLRHPAQTGEVRWNVPCGYRCAKCNPIAIDQW